MSETGYSKEQLNAMRSAHEHLGTAANRLHRAVYELDAADVDLPEAAEMAAALAGLNRTATNLQRRVEQALVARYGQSASSSRRPRGSLPTV